MSQLPQIKISLFLIDDDDINTFIITKIAERSGYDVDIHDELDGKLAVQYIESLASKNLPMPDVILIDINMPVMNGWEFVEAVAAMEVENNSLMYMLSSSVYENDIEKTKTYKSVQGFISKPLSMDRLKEIFATVAAKKL